MGRPGRKPTPREVLKSRGTYREDRHGGGLAPMKSRPKRPTGFDQVEVRLWNALMRHLEELGVICRVDVFLYERYVVTLRIWMRARETVAEEGSTYTMQDAQKNLVPRKHPAADQIAAFNTVLLGMEREMGLTPSARRGLTALSDDEDDAGGGSGSVYL